MGMHINVGKAGLVLGALLGGWHLGWSALVGLKWAQPVVDFLFWIHFIKPVYVIEPFEITRAAILLIVTSGLGFVFGSTFALIWNAVHEG